MAGISDTGISQITGPSLCRCHPEERGSAPRDRTTAGPVDAAGVIYQTACSRGLPINVIKSAWARTVPRAGFTAAQDDKLAIDNVAKHVPEPTRVQK